MSIFLSKIIALHENALRSETRVSDLLLEIRNLPYGKGEPPDDEIENFKQWARDELNGYPESADIPSYRKVSSTLRGYNSKQGIDDLRT